MKSIKKFLIIVLIALISLSIISNVSFASDVLSQFNGNPTGGVVGGSKVSIIMASILQVVRIVGSGLAVAILLVLGIKYTIASASDRADIKKSATAYVIGAIIMFGASGLLGIIQEIIENSLGKSAGT